MGNLLKKNGERSQYAARYANAVMSIFIYIYSDTHTTLRKLGDLDVCLNSAQEHNIEMGNCAYILFFG